MDVGGGFFRGGRDHRRQFLRPTGGRGQRRGRRLELGRSRRYGLDDFADRGLEAVGKLCHVGLALSLGAALHRLHLVAAEADDRLHRLQIAQRLADLVVTLDQDAVVQLVLDEVDQGVVELLHWPWTARMVVRPAKPRTAAPATASSARLRLVVPPVESAPPMPSASTNSNWSAIVVARRAFSVLVKTAKWSSSERRRMMPASTR